MNCPIDGLSQLGHRSSTNARGKIEFKDVKFRYPTRPDAVVCDDLSITIEPGEVVALVGPSGSGKVSLNIRVLL
jgi:ABC-type multidrug transport system fused ATPase/permease subunit